MQIQLIHILGGRAGCGVESDKLRSHHKSIHEGDAVRSQLCLPVTLTNDNSALSGLRVAHKLDKVRHVVGRRAIERRYIEIAHQSACLPEFDRKKERS